MNDRLGAYRKLAADRVTRASVTALWLRWFTLLSDEQQQSSWPSSISQALSLRACIVVKHSTALADSAPFLALVPHTLSVAHKHGMFLVCSIPFSDPRCCRSQIQLCYWQCDIVLIPNGSSWWIPAWRGYALVALAKWTSRRWVRGSAHLFISSERDMSSLSLLVGLSWLCILSASMGWRGLGARTRFKCGIVFDNTYLTGTWQLVLCLID